MAPIEVPCNYKDLELLQETLYFCEMQVLQESCTIPCVHSLNILQDSQEYGTKEIVSIPNFLYSNCCKAGIYIEVS